ncbi:MAG: putative glycosyltransferase [Lysobacterales bacterium]|jgi:predicted glycosyltransferase
MQAPFRVLLYSHDSWGLGHLRRSLAIAREITNQSSQANVLVVTGSPVATQFELPDRCDVLKLPSVSKDQAGAYIPRNLSGSIAGTIDLRSRLIHESYRSYDPHLIIIDHQLTGLHGEALGMMRDAKKHGKLLIYGMRDILDAPATVAPAWDTPENRWALKHAYDRIFIYGTPEVFDPPVQYKVLEELRHKIEFTGYIVTPISSTNRRAIPSFRKKVLVTMGGGEDGQQRIEAYLNALMIAPVDWDSHIVTGPLLDSMEVRRLKRRIRKSDLTEQVRISQFFPNIPQLLQDSDAVVSMAGYNSCAEILQSGVQAVLMPRSFPRQEQLIRAGRFEKMGLAQCVVSEDPGILRQAVEKALSKRRSQVKVPSLDGLNRLCTLIWNILGQPTESIEQPQLKIAAD